MSTNFDPFRFNQVPGPKPVEGHLPPVWLIDEDEPVPHTRPAWFRSLAAVVIAVFLGTTVLTVLRQISGAWSVPLESQHLR